MVRSRIATICCAALTLCLCASPALLAKDKEKPIRKLTFDETAPVVALFDGIEDGRLKVRLSPKSAQDSTVSIKNLTDGPLTVALPKAAVGVHILPQFQQPGFFNQGTNNGQQNGQQNQNQSGQSQSVGGGFQAMGNQGQGSSNLGNGGNNPLGGMNLFSIPPEKTVQVKLKTVCLNYGWPDPLPGMKYELRSVESQISDPALRSLLERYSARVDGQAMQAAAWHLSNRMTWNQLARVPGLGGNAIIGNAMFPPLTLKSAQVLVNEAVNAAETENDAAPKTVSTDVLTNVRGR